MRLRKEWEGKIGTAWNVGEMGDKEREVNSCFCKLALYIPVAGFGEG